MTALLLAAILPLTELRTCYRVADEYRLTTEQTRLLCAIRRAENGRDNLAFGVVNPRARVDFETQCRWCANTIRKRYTGDLAAFSRRWCPTDWRNWLRNVRFFLKKQKEDAR